ncbi:hypothetical protein Pla52o_19750 [Novipirellula galeiformis]|uniref:Uncharacterized protein n=1 Tax=Novipirellula galeiformis TaxID=2528004 RepID=A0A5C6CID6_9BACT|nr:hypothetical protein Pla52o_19750 [Novipirellula galeiformis]
MRRYYPAFTFVLMASLIWAKVWERDTGIAWLEGLQLTTMWSSFFFAASAPRDWGNTRH